MMKYCVDYKKTTRIIIIFDQILFFKLFFWIEVKIRSATPSQTGGHRDFLLAPGMVFSLKCVILNIMGRISLEAFGFQINAIWLKTSTTRYYQILKKNVWGRCPNFVFGVIDVQLSTRWEHLCENTLTKLHISRKCVKLQSPFWNMLHT